MLGAAADAVRWPFERVAWGVERVVLWPLQERFAGWSPRAHSAGAAALATIAVAAIVAGVLLLPGGGPTPRDRVAEATRVTIATPDPQPAEAPDGPVLHGASPDFSTGGVQADQTGAAGAELNAGGSTAEPATSDEALSDEEDGAATTSSKVPVPAGPAAMKVARRLLRTAFVFYEVGEKTGPRPRPSSPQPRAPELDHGAAAHGRRASPSDAEVPKAKRAEPRPWPACRQGLHGQRRRCCGSA